MISLCFFSCDGDHRELHVLANSFPIRRSSDLFGGGRLLERDRSLDPDPVLEGPVPLDRQRRRIPQGGSTLGEPLVELADQSVDLRVERDVGKTLRDLLQHEVGPEVIDVRAQHEQVVGGLRSEEHTSELQSLMRISYAVFCLKKKTNRYENTKASIT